MNERLERQERLLSQRATRTRSGVSSLRPRPIMPTIEQFQRDRTAHNQTLASAEGQTLYDLLEVEPYTPEEEVRRTRRDHGAGGARARA